MNYSNEIMYNFYKNLKKLFELNNRTTINLHYNELLSQSKKNSQTAVSASIFYDTYKMFHINKSSNHYFVSCKSSAKEFLDNYNVPYMTSTAKTDLFCYKILYTDSSILNEFAEFWLKFYDSVCLSSSNSYSGCSRYLECSNELHCVNPDVTDGLFCKYRRNLEKGYIFYGENSIILPDNSFDMEKVQKNLQRLPKSNIQKIIPEMSDKK